MLFATATFPRHGLQTFKFHTSSTNETAVVKNGGIPLHDKNLYTSCPCLTGEKALPMDRSAGLKDL
jgi:hypothetical protein